ncbi:uncharacterized protein BJ212DRAFT_1282480 [Suillus subaureus]|uniref:Protein-S-isoprenylcysteine O-methyltransferase n=1 Tax=Suillus subaureus TaxID=48587 RepID=A0A9P7E0A2_9AGAM|nr:uncharacterized protein BJ212DRAFT_1282480 [Suillus subaureus]KAG1807147.1 hypothetical protein BJ212DRAFT_1282480 [Suillus subaureus]
MVLLRVLYPTSLTPAFFVGSIAIAIGGASRLYCISTLGKLWSFQLSVRKEHRLVTSGPYSVVRHPSYTGLLLQSAGFAIMHGSQGSWMRQSGILQVPFIIVLAMTSFFVFTTFFAWISISRPQFFSAAITRREGGNPPLLEIIILQFQSLWDNDIKKVCGFDVSVVVYICRWTT